MCKQQSLHGWPCVHSERTKFSSCWSPSSSALSTLGRFNWTPGLASTLTGIVSLSGVVNTKAAMLQTRQVLFYSVQSRCFHLTTSGKVYRHTNAITTYQTELVLSLQATRHSRTLHREDPRQFQMSLRLSSKASKTRGKWKRSVPDPFTLSRRSFTRRKTFGDSFAVLCTSLGWFV